MYAIRMLIVMDRMQLQSDVVHVLLRQTFCAS